MTSHSFGSSSASSARRISGLEVNEVEENADIPNSLDFFEMYGVKKKEELQVPERWKKNRAYHSMRALIGKKAGEQDCYLDIHEKYHGPHGLIEIGRAHV